MLNARGKSGFRRSCLLLSGLVLQASVVILGQSGPDYSVLRINEIIAENDETDPADKSGLRHDMVEIYNTGEQTLALGSSTIDKSLGLSGKANPTSLEIWNFPGGGIANIPAKGSIVVFLDRAPEDAQFCELYAGFSVKNDGTEPITLWGPVTGTDDEGNPIRAVLDRVWLPPLSANVSLGRFPDGAGVALGAGPVAEMDKDMYRTLEVYRYAPPGSTSFGACGPCKLQQILPACPGAENSSGGNLRPRIARVGHSTNHPAAGEAVEFTAQVEDERDPVPPFTGGEPSPTNIARVWIEYKVDGVEAQDIPMSFLRFADGGSALPSRPMERWSEWVATIPGQAAGSRVEFVFWVEDSEGLSSSDPETLCPEGQGPCDREFGGPNCTLDLADQTCQNPVFTGRRFVSCSVPFSYLSGAEVRSELAGLSINEVVARQDSVLEDPTEGPCTIDDACPSSFRDCCKYREDFIELVNSSASSIDLSGLWLSDSPFQPRAWAFPANSQIGPGERLIVWCDNDGGKCPDPAETNPPCFWECPDPTDPAKQWYHTNFALDADADQIYLFDREASRYAVVSGVEFMLLPLNESLSRIPDGDPSGCWIVTDPSPSAANVGTCPEVGPKFLRGDGNADCLVDITDAVFALNYLFLGGSTPPCMDAADADDNGTVEITDPIGVLNYLFLGGAPPRAPGPETLGSDPTPDDLGVCEEACE